MPYSRSRARVSFDSNLDKLLSLSRKASYRNKGFSYDHQNLIYQSGIFLACASIEEYLKNFIEDLIFEYRSNGAVLGELPDNIRALVLLLGQKDIFKTYVFNGDETKSLKKLHPSSPLYRISNNNTPIGNQVKAKFVIGTKKYPSVKNLKILYNRLGINNILQQAHARGQRDYTNQLESFLSIREAISHQAPPSLTFDDIKRNFGNIRSLINSLDRIKYSHVVKHSSNNYWPD